MTDPSAAIIAIAIGVVLSAWFLAREGKLKSISAWSLARYGGYGLVGFGIAGLLGFLPLAIIPPDMHELRRVGITLLLAFGTGVGLFVAWAFPNSLSGRDKF